MKNIIRNKEDIMSLASNTKQGRFSLKSGLTLSLAILLTFGALLLPSHVNAQAKVGTTGAQFLEQIGRAHV